MNEPSAPSASSRADDSALGHECSFDHTDRCFRIGTYNAGLAVGIIPYASERNQKVAQALSTQPLDLLCVQEFWLEDHWNELVDTVADRLPNVFRLPPAAPARKGACTTTETAPLRSCLARHCAGLRSDALARCTVRSCAWVAGAMTQGCVSCIVANPTRSADEIVQACLETGEHAITQAPAKTEPAKKGMNGVLAYGGSYGIGLLTRATILERDAVRFDAALNPRAALYVRLKTEQLDELQVFCTHLTAVLSHVPYPGHGSWLEEQTRQIDELLAFIDRKARGTTPVVLVGDLNCGPALGSTIRPSQPALYARLLGAGFVDPFAAQADVECTFCSDSLLNGGSSHTGSLIDHVLFRSFPGQARGRPMLTENIMVDVGGKSVRTSLSDHNGLFMSLVPSARGRKAQPASVLGLRTKERSAE